MGRSHGPLPKAPATAGRGTPGESPPVLRSASWCPTQNQRSKCVLPGKMVAPALCSPKLLDARAPCVIFQAHTFRLMTRPAPKGRDPDSLQGSRHQPGTTLVLVKGSSCGINSHDSQISSFLLFFSSVSFLIWGFSSFQMYKSIYKVRESIPRLAHTSHLKKCSCCNLVP